MSLLPLFYGKEPEKIPIFETGLVSHPDKIHVQELQDIMSAGMRTSYTMERSDSVGPTLVDRSTSQTVRVSGPVDSSLSHQRKTTLRMENWRTVDGTMES